MRGRVLSDEGKHVTQEEAVYARAKAEKVNSVFMKPPWAAAERERESTKPQGPGKEVFTCGLVFVLTGVGGTFGRHIQDHSHLQQNAPALLRLPLCPGHSFLPACDLFVWP